MRASDARRCCEETPLRLLTLAGWSYWLYQLLARDHLRLYVHPRFSTPVLWAVIFLAVLAVFQAVQMLGTRGIRASPMAHGRLITYIVVLLPLVAGYAIVPSGLGSSLAEQRGGFLAHEERQSDLPAGELEAMFASNTGRQQISANQFRDLSYLLWNKPASLHGRSVEVIGFIYHQNGLLPGQFLLARYEISCCTADAVVIACLCQMPEGQPLPIGGWAIVQGSVSGGHYLSQLAGQILVDSLLPTEPPDDPYVYAGK